MHKMHKEKVVLYCTRKKVKLLLCCEPPHSTSPSSTHFQITLGLAAWLFATEKSQLTNCPTAMPGAPPPHQQAKAAEKARFERELAEWHVLNDNGGAEALAQQFRSNPQPFYMIEVAIAFYNHKATLQQKVVKWEKQQAKATGQLAGVIQVEIDSLNKKSTSWTRTPSLLPTSKNKLRQEDILFSLAEHSWAELRANFDILLPEHA